MKKVKNIGIILIALFIYNLSCYSNSSSTKEHLNKKQPYSNELIDSLQGTWKCLRDTTVTITINGRTFKEITSDSGFTDIKIYTMYFSDVVIDEYHEHTFDEVGIDTSKLSGTYLVNVSAKDNSIECYKFGHITYSSNDTIFSMTDVWAKRKNVNFKKIN